MVVSLVTSWLLLVMMVSSPMYPSAAERTEFAELQQEVQRLARDLPRTLRELGLTSVVHHVHELKRNEYLGCYQDSNHHLFPRRVLTSAHMTTEICISACRAAGYTYAATERARRRRGLRRWWTQHDCHCGVEHNFNRLGERVCDDSQCNSRCPGNWNQMCGGINKMSVYKIDAVPSCEGGPRSVGSHWDVTDATTDLQYQGSPQCRPFAFPLEERTPINVQSTLENMSENIMGFPSTYPATSAEGMPNLVTDYTSLLASFQAPGLRLTPASDTVLELDQHFAIKSYSCSLQYNPIANRRRSRRGISLDVTVVSSDPYEVMVKIKCY